jgi:hypothetical protein
MRVSGGQAGRTVPSAEAGGCERPRTARTVDGHHCCPPCAVGTSSSLSCRAMAARPRPRAYSRRMRSTTSRGKVGRRPDVPACLASRAARGAREGTARARLPESAVAPQCLDGLHPRHEATVDGGDADAEGFGCLTPAVGEPIYLAHLLQLGALPSRVSARPRVCGLCGVASVWRSPGGGTMPGRARAPAPSGSRETAEALPDRYRDEFRGTRLNRKSPVARAFSVAGL